MKLRTIASLGLEVYKFLLLAIAGLIGFTTGICALFYVPPIRSFWTNPFSPGNDLLAWMEFCTRYWAYFFGYDPERLSAGEESIVLFWLAVHPYLLLLSVRVIRYLAKRNFPSTKTF